MTLTHAPTDRPSQAHAPTLAPDPATTTTIRRRPLLAAAMFAGVAAYTASTWLGHGAASAYGLAVFAILGTKLALSLLPARRWPRPDPATRAGVVVTLYNEDPELLRACLESLLHQSHPPARIAVVDDASTDPAAYAIAAEYAAADPRIRVYRQPVNLGKREALARGFTALAGEVDVYVCVDSDSALEPDAIREGLRPFADRRTTATTGIVLPSNHDTNTITRLQDVRYANSFLGERAAYTRFGAVLCVCGALAFYRADVALRHLDAFLGQTFLGNPATVGDDRHMTNLALTEGRVYLAENAISHTAVPERLGHYVRQQARWGRSFFRESLFALRNLSPTRPAWWLTVLEVTQWAVFSTILVYVLAVHPIITGEWLVGQYFLFVGLMAAARAVRYFDVNRHGQPVAARLRTFAVAPLYGYLSLLVLLPLRLYSLATLRTAAWGTRAAVEVTAAGEPAPARPRRGRGAYRQRPDRGRYRTR